MKAARPINTMKAKIYVTLKPSVLDPQGKAIHRSLETMGHSAITGVRQGKYFEITLDPGLSKESAQSEVERIAREVLSNPVIEEYRVEIE